MEDKKERRSPHCDTARRSPHCDCRWRREGVGGVVGAMLRERDAESKADKKAKDAESKADKKAKEAEARVAKGKGKGQSKGKKSKGSGKGKGTGESSRADTAKVRKPCVHYEATRFQYLGLQCY